ncbi:MAG: CopG family transcriptional regulator [Candidatus Bathyarchaeia archaeon]
MSENDFASVTIPKRLLEKIRKKILNTSFSSASEYVTYLLEKELSGTEDEEVFSREDEEKVKERLRRLGYL